MSTAAPTPGTHTLKHISPLTEQEEARIRADEMYREEVRKQLATPKTRTDWWLALLNSPFGIFLLSSCLISGVTTIYTRHKESNEKEAARLQAIASLTDEISFRQSQLDAALRVVETPSLLGLNPNSSGESREGEHADQVFYIEACLSTVLAAKKGLIDAPPADSESDLAFRSLNIGAKLFPYRQGSRPSDYRILALEPLAIRRWRLQNPEKDLPGSDDQLEKELKDLEDASFNLAKTSFCVEGNYGNCQAVASLNEMIEQLRPAIKDVQEKFELVKQNELVK